MRLVIEIKTTTIRSIHKDEFLFLSLYLLLVSQYVVSIVTIVIKPVFQYLTYRISNRDCVCTERKMNRVLGWLQWHKLFGRITPLEEVRLRRYERHKLNHVQKNDILSVFTWKFSMGKWKKKDPWVGNGVYTVLDCHHPSIHHSHPSFRVSSVLYCRNVHFPESPCNCKFASKKNMYKIGEHERLVHPDEISEELPVK